LRQNPAIRKPGYRIGEIRLVAVILSVLVITVVPGAANFQPNPGPPVFLLEIPTFGIKPTDHAELTIPSTNVAELLIHLMRPVADNIDYGQIYPYVNGEAAGTVAEFTANERGKVIRVQLKSHPDIRLVAGRNTIEIRAQNRRGRVFYASFVLRTVTDNRNQDLAYSVTTGSNASQPVPPELVLLEPERAIERRGQRPTRIRVAGVATAATSVAQVTINGEPIPLKRGNQGSIRSLGLAYEEKRVTFDSFYTLAPDTAELVVEAVDATGNKTRLTVPVRTAGPSSASLFQGRKYALIIGISRFQSGDERLPNLAFADVDARSIYHFLQSPAGGRFTSENLLLLTNEQATIARLREALTSFVIKPGPDDLLLVFLASHGGPDPFAQQNLYFLAHDTEIGKMAETGLAMKDLQSLIQQNVRAKRVVLLIDTCHSAGLTESPRDLTRGLGNNLVNQYAERFLYAEEGRAVITSSDVNETAAEGSRWGGGHGVFTYWLLEGLQGQADANGDQLVTVGELFRFVRQRVRLDTQFRQNPRILATTNENLALAASARGAR
jgi:hypothetical protein